MENVLSMVSQIGFPAAMCLILAWYCKYLWEMYTKAVDGMEERYRQQLEQHHDIIINNTQAMTALVENIRQLKEEVKNDA